MKILDSVQTGAQPTDNHITTTQHQPLGVAISILGNPSGIRPKDQILLFDP